MATFFVVIVNEQKKTIAEIWDGVELKCSFRRTVSPVLFEGDMP